MVKHTAGRWKTQGTCVVIGDQVICKTSDDRTTLPNWACGSNTLENAANTRLLASAPVLLNALKFQQQWTMRDGSPCFCSVGKNEAEGEGEMPTLHTTACEIARKAIARTEGKTK